LVYAAGAEGLQHSRLMNDELMSVAGEDYEVFDLFLVAAIHSFEECAESVTTDFCAAYFAYQICNYGVFDVKIFLHLRSSAFICVHLT
jgi:hypothetical protein